MSGSLVGSDTRSAGRGELLVERLEEERGVVPAESKGIAQHIAHLGLAGFIRHAIEVALGIGIFEIDGGRDDAVLDRHGAGGEFHTTGGTEQMAGDGFRGTDGDFLRTRRARA